MTPTTRFRFIERIVPAPEYGKNIGKTVRILQQWWEPEQNIIYMVIGKKQGEWRDIPLEKNT
jgi:hypothetical protein